MDFAALRSVESGSVNLLEFQWPWPPDPDAEAEHLRQSGPRASFSAFLLGFCQRVWFWQAS